MNDIIFSEFLIKESMLEVMGADVKGTGTGTGAIFDDCCGIAGSYSSSVSEGIMPRSTSLAMEAPLVAALLSDSCAALHHLSSEM